MTAHEFELNGENLYCTASAFTKLNETQLIFFGGHKKSISNEEAAETDDSSIMTNEVAIFDSVTHSWSKPIICGSTFPRPRTRVQMIVLTDRDNTRRLLVCGGDNTWELYNEVDILTFSNPSTNSLGRMFEEEKTSDVEVVVNGHSIKAHKVVLYCRSEHFRQRLTQEPDVKQLVIEIAESFSLMKELLYYLYSDDVRGEMISYSDYEKFLALCEVYATEHVSRISQLLLLSHFNPSTFGQNTSVAFNMKQFSDIQLVVQGVTCYCHKAIICSRSEYFRALCLGDLMESKQTTINEPDDVQLEPFMAMMKYLYTLDVDIDEVKDYIIELLILSRRYAVDGLTKTLEQVIGQNLTEENASSIKELADDLELNYLARRVSSISSLIAKKS
eukprot:TRINITY_DN4092_c0_g2_i4.p1 TRINITY_DN4092_c0_g2~~TRINITY_DN4092_c0_g2_i4.p1  ORF type:complete len:456 (-),score=100.84 TRINITY_DN4092_c0_g2_i4:62-1225(-)